MGARMARWGKSGTEGLNGAFSTAALQLAGGSCGCGKYGSRAQNCTGMDGETDKTGKQQAKHRQVAQPSGAGVDDLANRPSFRRKVYCCSEMVGLGYG